MSPVSRTLFVLTLAALLAGCASTDTPQQAEAPAPVRPPASEDQATSGALQSLSLTREGAVLLEQGRYEEALRQFQTANRLAPGNPTTHNMIGMCYLRMEQFDRALGAFGDTLKLAPSYTDARNNRGVAYMSMEQYRMAEVDFLAVLSDPTYPHRWRAYYNLGMTYMQLGEMAAAEQNIRRAVTAPTPVFEAYLRLGEIHERRGEDMVAIDLYEEASLKFPERIEATFALGKLYARQGRMDEAEPLLERVISSQPRSQMAREAAEILESSG